MTFAICLANRGTFPGSLFDAARQELTKALAAQGHAALLLPSGTTRHDAVGSPKEGRAYAKFLAAHRSEVDGVILSPPDMRRLSPTANVGFCACGLVLASAMRRGAAGTVLADHDRQ